MSDDLYADVQAAIDGFDELRQRIMLLRLAKRYNNGSEHFDHSPQGASWLCLACERAALAAQPQPDPTEILQRIRVKQRPSIRSLETDGELVEAILAEEGAEALVQVVLDAASAGSATPTGDDDDGG